MAWTTRKRGKRKYYTRTRKINGRRVHTYVGHGPIAELAAALDRLHHQQRLQEWQHWRQQKPRWQAATQPLRTLCQESNRLTTMILNALGFHQCLGGAWARRRYARKTPTHG